MHMPNFFPIDQIISGLHHPFQSKRCRCSRCFQAIVAVIHVDDTPPFIAICSHFLYSRLYPWRGLVFIFTQTITQSSVLFSAWEQQRRLCVYVCVCACVGDGGVDLWGRLEWTWTRFASRKYIQTPVGGAKRAKSLQLLTVEWMHQTVFVHWMRFQLDQYSSHFTTQLLRIMIHARESNDTTSRAPWVTLGRVWCLKTLKPRTL